VRILNWTQRELVGRDNFFAVDVEVAGETLVVRFSASDQGVLIREISGQNLTSSLLRNLRLGDLRLKISEFFLQRVDQTAWSTMFPADGRYRLEKIKATPKGLPPNDLADSEAAAEINLSRIALASARIHLSLGRPNRGRAAKSPDFYRQVAEMYLVFLSRHGQRVVKAMTDELRKQPEHYKLSRDTVSTWVRRARQEQWLTSASPGKAGGGPGPKLISWLNERQDDEGE
jgi:hypothetical protein